MVHFDFYPQGGHMLKTRYVAGISAVVMLVLGAGGAIAADLVAKAQPDGYSLLVYGANFYTLPLLRKVPYDVVKDFAPITAAGSTPNVLVVNSASTVKSVTDL